MNQMQFLETGDGPYDSEEVSIPENYLDFGSLLIPRLPQDVTVKIEVEEGSARGIALTLETVGSALQITLYSAPKSSGIWLEVLEQLEHSFATQSAKVFREAHAFGQSLRVSQIADTGTSEIRFIGVDGPRWFLRGMLSGAAASDYAEATFLESIFRAVIVRRGDEPMPPKELISLVLPPGVVPPPRSV